MGRGSTGTGRLLMVGGTVLGLVACSVLARTEAPVRADSPSALDVSVGAVATARAVRGEQRRVRPEPTGPGCQRVAVIGDSLMDNARGHLRSALDGAGLSSVIDAQPSRRIPATVRAPYSGVTASLQVRDMG